MIEMPLSSRHRIRNSSPGRLGPSTLPLGSKSIKGRERFGADTKSCVIVLDECLVSDGNFVNLFSVEIDFKRQNLTF